MKYVPHTAIGVRLDADSVQKLGLQEAYDAWDKEDPYFEPLLDAIGDACVFQPDAVRTLIEEHGGYVTGLVGFTSGCTYAMFDPEFDPADVAEWNAKVAALRAQGIEVVEGSWSQLM